MYLLLILSRVFQVPEAAETALAQESSCRRLCPPANFPPLLTVFLATRIQVRRHPDRPAFLVIIHMGRPPRPSDTRSRCRSIVRSSLGWKRFRGGTRAWSRDHGKVGVPEMRGHRMGEDEQDFEQGSWGVCSRLSVRRTSPKSILLTDGSAYHIAPDANQATLPNGNPRHRPTVVG